MTARRAAAVLAAALWLWAAGTFSGLSRVPGQVHLVLEQGLEAEAARSIAQRELEEDRPAPCFWGQTGDATVSRPDTGGSAQVTRTVLAGNPALLGADILAFRQGCLVDEQTAWALFGATRCAGQQLVYQGEHWTVLGTFQALSPTMLTAAQDLDGAALDRCVLAAEARLGTQEGEAFLVRRGLTGTVLDFYPLWALTKDLLLLAPGIVLLALARRCWKAGRRGLETRRVRQMVLAGGGLALAIGGLVILGSQAVIPADMVPSRWSDFDFWSRWWTAQRQNLLQIAQLAQGNRQLQILRDMVQSGIASTTAAVLTLAAWWRG